MSPNAIDSHQIQLLLGDLGHDRKALQELVSGYLEEAPRLLVDARKSVDDGDLISYQRAVQSLKVASTTFGALELAGHAKQLEVMGRSGVMPDSPQFEHLEKLWGAARDELVARHE